MLDTVQFSKRLDDIGLVSKGAEKGSHLAAELLLASERMRRVYDLLSAEVPKEASHPAALLSLVSPRSNGVETGFALSAAAYLIKIQFNGDAVNHEIDITGDLGASAPYTIDELVSSLNADTVFNAKGTAFKWCDPAVSVQPAYYLVIVSNETGATSAITLSAPSATSAYTVMGYANGTVNGDRSLWNTYLASMATHITDALADAVRLVDLASNYSLGGRRYFEPGEEPTS